MTAFRTILEPPALRCTRNAALSDGHACEFVLNIGLFFDGTDHNMNVRAEDEGPLQTLTRRRALGAGAWLWPKAIATLCLATLLVGCGSYAVGANDLVQDKSEVAVSIGAVGHYGSGIGVPRYSINGMPVGLSYGWGGGGAGWCCVLLPRHVDKPFLVTVKWETYRSNVKEERHHEATVPINFAVQPGEGGSGLYIHFIPGHRVEAWYAGPTPPSTEYPGPTFPRGPAPRYAPLPSEAPQPAQ